MTHHKRISLDRSNSFAICGSATVKIPELKVFRKLTPATVIMTAAERLFEKSFWTCEFGGESNPSAWLPLVLGLSVTGTVCRFKGSGPSSIIVVDNIVSIIPQRAGYEGRFLINRKEFWRWTTNAPT
jgi:hypothetical protein